MILKFVVADLSSLEPFKTSGSLWNFTCAFGIILKNQANKICENLLRAEKWLKIELIAEVPCPNPR